MMASPTTLLSRLELHARTMPVAVAYRDATTGEQLTWAELHERVLILSANLLSDLPPGALVLVVWPNQLEFPVIFLALMHAGLGALLMSVESSGQELLEIASRSAVAAVIAADRHLRHVPAILFKIGKNFFQKRNRTSHFVTSGGRLMLSSSGSTGLPKIVVRSLLSVDAVCAQMVGAIGFTESDQVLATVPLCHSYGIEHGLLAPVWAGSTTHLCRGLEWPTMLNELATRQITVLPGVPSMFEMLAELGSTVTSLQSLRAAYSAGAPLPETVAARFQARFGVPVGQLYGATEIGSVAYADARAPGFNPASVGRPMPGVSIRADASTDGQIMVKAPSMFDGYLGVAGSPLIDGFYPTGDLGEFDAAGNLRVTGRLKLLLDVGGLKVNPLEVEAVLRQHPDVADCVVVPVPQTATVLRLKAIVVASDVNAPPSLVELRRFARQRLASYKVPRMFELRNSLPISAAGKVQRHLV